jgi:hypothetical protein
MTGVPSGYWNGKFVAVCDPEPPPEDHGDRRPNPERPTPEQLLEPEEAVERARRGLDEYGLYERGDWRGTLEAAEPRDPVLVERLDRTDDYYYVVPRGPNGEQMSAAVNVDARFGDYLQALAFPGPGETFLAALEPENVLETVLERPLELPDHEGSLVLRDGLFCVYPILVWKPCRESLSPFYPFRMITRGTRQIFVRSDGAVFTELHEDAPGI